MVHIQYPSKFGKYILLDRINSGGMAEVYRAKLTGAEQFERLLAIKCMLPGLAEDEQFTSMFIDEAKLASQLSHANIVQIYELGRIDDRLYIAMELINGRDLRHIIKTAAKNFTPLPLAFAAYIVAKAAEGLDFAHRKAALDGSPLNLVHRDVSPQNILVSYDGEVKVVDFGIAKAAARTTETQSGILKGKFAYMAPEQIANVEIDRRTDIFALGIVLYESVTGKRLFSGENDLSVLEKVRNAEVPNLREVLPDMPDELIHILQKALTRDRDARYQWGSELAEALEALLIEERSIFGTKRAAQFMQTLYMDEISTLKQNLKKYALITDDDCVNIDSERREGKAHEVIELAFGERHDEPSEPQAKNPMDGSSGTTKVTSEDVLFDDLSVVSAVSLDAHGDPIENSVTERNADINAAVRASKKPASTASKRLLIGLLSLCVVMGGVLYLVSTEQLQDLSPSMLLDTSPADTKPAEPAEEKPRTPEPTAAPALPLPPPKQAAGNADKGNQENASDVRIENKAALDEAPKLIPKAPMPTIERDRPARKAEAPQRVIERPASQPPAVRVKPKPAPIAKPEKPVEPVEEPGEPVVDRLGYVSVKAIGVEKAKVFIDGAEVGYSPMLLRLNFGKHSVKLVEERNGVLNPVRTKILDAVLFPEHTRKTPLKLVVEME